MMDSVKDEGCRAPSGARNDKSEASLRTDVKQSVEKIALPTRKTETWRYSPLKKDLLDLPLAMEPQSIDENVILISAGRLVNQLELPEGVRVDEVCPQSVTSLHSTPSISSGTEESGTEEPRCLSLSKAPRFSQRHPMVCLNAVEANSQITITIDKNINVSEPIEIVYLDAPGTRTNARVLVQVGANASVQLLERNISTDNYTNSVMQIELADGAKAFHHQMICHDNTHTHAVFVSQAKDSRFEQFVLCSSKGFCRLDVDVDLRGEGASCKSQGAYLLTEKAHFDYHSYVKHNASHTRSDVDFRGLIDDHATGVFHSSAIATKDKKQIEAHQHNHNLLMSSTAKINTQPVLEIDTDDIACSHGATVGQIDEEAVFYCQSRGIRESKARAMLTQSFLARQSNCIQNVSLAKRFKCALCDSMKAHFGDDHDCGL